MPNIDPRINSYKVLERNYKNLDTENARLKKQLESAQKEKTDIALKLKEKEKVLKSKTLLKNEPLVRDIVTAEKRKYDMALRKKDAAFLKLQADYSKLQIEFETIGKIKPVKKDEFNKFLSSSIIDLQKELSSSEEEYEFIVRELEVETALLVEQRETGTGRNKKIEMVYVLPTTKQLTDTALGLLNRLKYSLVVVPKDD